MNPEPKITATMNTDPATMPTQAATLFSRLDSWMYTGCGGSATAAAGAVAGAGGGVSTGPGLGLGVLRRRRWFAHAFDRPPRTDGSVLNPL